MIDGFCKYDADRKAKGYEDLENIKELIEAAEKASNDVLELKKAFNKAIRDVKGMEKYRYEL